jgi:hypothetical protein
METTKDLQAKLQSIHNWRTTDEDEIAKRRYRAQTESLRVRTLDPAFPIYSNFAVKSESGLTYSVEIRSVSQRLFLACRGQFRQDSFRRPCGRWKNDWLVGKTVDGRPKGTSRTCPAHRIIYSLFMRATLDALASHGFLHAVLSKKCGDFCCTYLKARMW